MFILKKTRMVKSTTQDSIEYLKDLLMFPEENKVAIITIMVRDNVSIPKILPSILQEKSDVQEQLLKSLCDLTGYSFDELLEHKPEMVKQFRERYPDACKGCEERKKQWSGQFRKIKDELMLVKQVSAYINFSTELNAPARIH